MISRVSKPLRVVKILRGVPNYSAMPQAADLVTGENVLLRLREEQGGQECSCWALLLQSSCHQGTGGPCVADGFGSSVACFCPHAACQMAFLISGSHHTWFVVTCLDRGRSWMLLHQNPMYINVY